MNDRRTAWQVNRQAGRQTHKYAGRQKGGQIMRQIGKLSQTNRIVQSCTDKQFTYRQKNRQKYHALRHSHKIGGFQPERLHAPQYSNYWG